MKPPRMIYQLGNTDLARPLMQPVVEVLAEFNLTVSFNEIPSGFDIEKPFSLFPNANGLILDARIRPNGYNRIQVSMPSDFEINDRFIIWYCDEESEKKFTSLSAASVYDDLFFFYNTGAQDLRFVLNRALTSSSDVQTHQINGLFLNQALFMESPHASLCSNDDGLVLFVNQVAVELFGKSAARMMFQPLVSVYNVLGQEGSDFDFECAPLELQSVERDGRVCQLLRWDGVEINVVLVSKKVSDKQGQTYSLVYIRDITQELEFVKKLDDARQEAQKASLAKNEFLANISHELRTPLNSILGMTDIALEISTNKEQEEYLHILKVSANSLYQLITTMLDYVKLDSGTFNIRERAFPLSESLDAVAAQFAIQCHTKNLGFHIVEDTGLDGLFIGDETRVKQIMLNLLSNAYKFTHIGEIILFCKEVESHEPPPKAKGAPTDDTEGLQDVMLEIGVHDTGIGIAAERQAEIFQPFVQLEVKGQDGTAGTGIGLTITRLLVEAMNGSIHVLSEQGRGSTFISRLWLKRGALRKNKDFSTSAQNNRSIVIVGDSWGWLDSLAGILSTTKYRVELCRSVEEVRATILTIDHEKSFFIFQGTFAKVHELIDLLRQVEYSKLMHQAHFLTLRLSREEERMWHSAPFPYQIMYEPLRASKLLRAINELELEQSLQQRAAAYGHYSSPYNLKICYAEDESLNRTATSRVLADAGHEVEAFPNGTDLVDYLRKRSPDLILVDIVMPGPSGHEIASMIRSGELGETNRKLPIIALTAHDSLEEKQHAEILGMDAFLSKPFSPQTLLVVVDRVWERFLEGRSSVHRRKEESELERLKSIANMASLDEWETAQELARQYRENYKGRLSKEMSENSFKLLLALRRKDRQTVQQIIETIQNLLHKGADNENSRSRG